MSKMKVFGGLVMGAGRRQVRGIVAAPSKAAALRILNASAGNYMSMYHFSDYWAETRNETELAVALNNPGILFLASDSMSKDFKECKP